MTLRSGILARDGNQLFGKTIGKIFIGVIATGVNQLEGRRRFLAETVEGDRCDGSRRRGSEL